MRVIQEWAALAVLLVIDPRVQAWPWRFQRASALTPLVFGVIAQAQKVETAIFHLVAHAINLADMCAQAKLLRHFGSASAMQSTASRKD
jgi:hypothetical protein